MIDEASWQVEHYDTADSLWGHPERRTLIGGGAPGTK
jgi:hypothetical protein